jgi:tetratricopeptide (TPR) repeat protein
MNRCRFAIAIVASLVVAGSGAHAGQDDPRLAPLFDTLKTTSSDDEAKMAERQIWQIWIEHKNPEVARLMRQGMAAMGEDDQEAALDDFDAVVKYDKNFAEGWNKRATIEFAMGDYSASVADIERTLALEPRHFGALAGLGQIYLALDRKTLALKAFHAALAINPHLGSVRQAIQELEKGTKGNPI